MIKKQLRTDRAAVQEELKEGWNLEYLMTQLMCTFTRKYDNTNRTGKTSATTKRTRSARSFPDKRSQDNGNKENHNTEPSANIGRKKSSKSPSHSKTDLVHSKKELQRQFDGSLKMNRKCQSKF